MQRWRFLVIRGPKVKETVGALYKRAWDERVAPRYRAGEPAPVMSREQFRRLLAAAEYLAAHIHESPVWIIACLEGATATRTSGSLSIQRFMLLAARALGLVLCLATDRLPNGPVRAGAPCCAHRYRQRRPVRPAFYRDQGSPA
jgi:hypothetical protein